MDSYDMYYQYFDYINNGNSEFNLVESNWNYALNLGNLGDHCCHSGTSLKRAKQGSNPINILSQVKKRLEKFEICLDHNAIKMSRKQ